MMHQWESITEYTKRMKVFKGWVVKSVDENGSSMVFIPDANHEWRI